MPAIEMDLLVDKVKVIAQTAHADLLIKFVDLLYDQAQLDQGMEYFSPEDLAEIAEGLDRKSVV